MANYTVINVKEFWTDKDFFNFSVERFLICNDVDPKGGEWLSVNIGELAHRW